MRQEKRQCPRNLGIKIFVGIVLLFFVFGVARFARFVHIRLQWNAFQLQYAACTYDVGTEGGALKAVHESETVSVCHANANYVYRMIKTASVADCRSAKDVREQIFLEFSDGGTAVLSQENDGRVHVDFTNPAGDRWKFHLGKCDYSKMRKLLSVEGAAIENAPWTD